MTDNLRALIEAELILLRMAADEPPAPDPPIRVRVVTPEDPDYGDESVHFNEDGLPIMRITIHFDRLNATELEDELDD